MLYRNSNNSVCISFISWDANCDTHYRTVEENIVNNKVLLPELKRHTSRRVASTPSVVLTGSEGVGTPSKIQIQMGVYPIPGPGPEGRGGTPSQVQVQMGGIPVQPWMGGVPHSLIGGTHPALDGGTPSLDRDRGYPHWGEGNSIQGRTGYPCPRGVLLIQGWMGVPSPSDGGTHHPKLDGGYLSPVMGVPPVQGWMGVSTPFSDRGTTMGCELTNKVKLLPSPCFGCWR